MSSKKPSLFFFYIRSIEWLRLIFKWLLSDNEDKEEFLEGTSLF